MLNGLGWQGPQSALDAAGDAAARILDLFQWMSFGSLWIWTGVVGLALYGYLKKRAPLAKRRARHMVLALGAVFPTIVLTGLLSYGLASLPSYIAPAPEGALTIRVTGHQYWWRVRYSSKSGQPVELANEIRLPVGMPVEFLLESTDVIHSFWIPALGGKVDMIPGSIRRVSPVAARAL